MYGVFAQPEPTYPLYRWSLRGLRRRGPGTEEADPWKFASRDGDLKAYSAPPQQARRIARAVAHTGIFYSIFRKTEFARIVFFKTLSSTRISINSCHRSSTIVPRASGEAVRIKAFWASAESSNVLASRARFF